ncbi:carbon-nitrogen hydrolase family protein [Desulfovibrio inopinatus]|uniref:carbon-nitrogen hydrolase family protein n=1 Tax=Desulfovibrio inopinatus TaxID=102109 RepID=UPI0003F4D5A4|nr:carbon-nitrogen hydrolase family protein [Desulfovibrio inopinatus]
MARYLPILAMQETSRSFECDMDEFEDEIVSLLADFPKTRLVIYPENHLFKVDGTPEQRSAQMMQWAQQVDGPLMQRLSHIARRAKVWLLPGTFYEDDGNGGIYNTSPLFSPAGELVATYRKCFPWRPYEPYTPGQSFCVVDLPGIGRLGLSICYDIWFPEVCRQLAWMGAEVIINQAQTSTCDREKERVLVQANAISNQTFIVSVNAAAPAGTGQSLIADPEGNVRVQLPSENAAIMTDVLNLDEVERVREFGTCGLNRMWSQCRPTDPVLELPAYGGRIAPDQWACHLESSKSVTS